MVEIYGDIRNCKYLASQSLKQVLKLSCKTVFYKKVHATIKITVNNQYDYMVLKTTKYLWKNNIDNKSNLTLKTLKILHKKKHFF